MDNKDDQSLKKEDVPCFVEVFYKIPVPVFITSCDTGEFLWVNRRFEEKTGYLKPDIESTSLDSTLLFPKETEQKKLFHLIKSETSFSDYRVSLKTKSAETISATVSGECVDLYDQKVMFCLLNDVSKQIKTLENLKHHLAIEQIIMKMASEYINLPLKQANEKINEALKELTIFFKADRAYIFRYHFEKGTVTNIFEWCAPGIEPVIDKFQNVSIEEMMDWVEFHKKGQLIKIEDVSMLKNDRLKSILQSLKIKSIIAIPIMNGQDCLGFMGIESIRDYYRYTGKEERLLSLFAAILANVDTRRELYLAEKRARESNRVKNEFLSNLSHEIRTPITGIIASLETLLAVLENEEYLYLINMAHKSAIQLETVFDDLYDIIRLNKEDYEESEEKVIVADIVGKTYDLFKICAEEKGLNFNIESFNVPDFFGNGSRIKQMIDKLLDNAIKFTFSGEVKVILSYKELTWQSGLLEIEVTDTGIGMDKKTQKRIFEMFYQKDLSLTKEFQGLGLGLPKVSAIVKNLNGNISIKSFPNVGSTFTCLIPVKPVVTIHPGFKRKEQ
ncbi:MAG TPA: ATP-binding protein [Thermotogota bacterium]|nr:ATP-binding protein [Thermotogota bacterium]HPR95243.1 ATP-binding protein [Thermotogota bacterium]